jgi:Tfp pilus assembly protein PilN
MSFINLLPKDYFARKAHRRANMLCLVLFGLVMAGVLGAAFVSDRGLQKTRRVYDRVNESYAEAGKLIGQMQKLEATKQEMFKKASLTTGLLERVPRSYVLAMVTNALPKRASVKELKLSTERRAVVTITKGDDKSRYAKATAERNVQTKQPAQTEVTITVTGMASTDAEVAQFIAAMARCPLIDTVVLIYTQEKEFKDQIVREFKVDMRLKPGAEVVAPDDGENDLARADVTNLRGENR